VQTGFDKSGSRLSIVRVPRRANLAERNILLGLKSNLFGRAGMTAPLLVVFPGFGERAPIGGWDAGLFGG
jgi:hypothetical protein